MQIQTKYIKQSKFKIAEYFEKLKKQFVILNRIKNVDFGELTENNNFKLCLLKTIRPIL